MIVERGGQKWEPKKESEKQYLSDINNRIRVQQKVWEVAKLGTAEASNEKPC
jgi:hypothetical protein